MKLLKAIINNKKDIEAIYKMTYISADQRIIEIGCSQTLKGH